jgi:UDP-glucose 4-epimerase
VLPRDFSRADEAVQLLIGDIRDEETVRHAACSADVIVHLAANTGVLPSIENPRADCSANVVGTLNALEAAREQGVRHFVLASSGAVLGEQTPPIHELKVPKPLSPYGASKLAGEGYCSVYSACFAIERQRCASATSMDRDRLSRAASSPSSSNKRCAGKGS